MRTKFDRLLDKSKRGELLSELSWIAKRAGPYKRFIAVYILIGIIGIALTFVSSVASKNLIDAVQFQDRSALIPSALLFAGMGIGSMVFSAFSSRFSAKINVRVLNELRSEIFSRILGAEWQSVMGFHSGDILNRLTTDIPVIVKAILTLLPGLITKGAQFAGAFFIIFYYDRVMACIALMGAPVIVLSSRFLVRRMKAYNDESKKVSSELMAFSEEAAQNISFVKSFSLSSLFVDKYNALQDKQKTITLNFNKFSILTTSVISVIGLMVSYASYCWGVYRLWNGAISYGTMVLFIQLAANLTSSFSSLVGIVPEAVTASTCAGRVRELLNMPPEKTQDADISVPSQVPQIVFDHVSFRYRKGGEIFKSISFSVEPGEVLALIGRSGSGKTTVLRLLLGLVSPLEGRAYLRFPDHETDISPETRHLFSYVSQENMLFSGTIADNLRMVKPDATDEEIEKVLHVACADFVFDLPEGIETVVSMNGKSFSQGQVQRLSIARAMISDACILLLDEATSSLDKQTEKKIIENIFNSDFRKTCILTTHRDSMLPVCDKVLRIEEHLLFEEKM